MTIRKRRNIGLPGYSLPDLPLSGSPNHLIFGPTYSLERFVLIKLMASSRKGLLRGLPSRLARAAAKKSWENRDAPNWRDRVGDLLEGKQIFVKDLREFNALYVAARRKECKHVASNFSHLIWSSGDAAMFSDCSQFL